MREFWLILNVMDGSSLNRYNNRPIGIFDSGAGGLSVVKAFQEVLPWEDLIYFGDTARLPYGSKSREVVTEFALQISGFLRRKGVKILVVACNTASAFSLPVLRKKLPIPVVGMIEPGAEAAVRRTQNRRVGVVGTRGTIESGAYEKALKKASSRLRVIGQACPLFVPLVEEGWWEKSETYSIAERYLNPLKRSGIDTLILGCTHYPVIRHVFLKVLGSGLNLVDPGQEASLCARSLLREKGLACEPGKKGETIFFSSDAPDRFRELGMRFLGRPIREVHLKRF